MRRLLVLCCLLLIAGCGDGEEPSATSADGGGASSATTTSSAAVSGSTSTAPADEAGAPDEAGPFSTSPTSIPAGERGLLTSVRHASHEGFYRVVFEFSGGIPGYRASFTERPVTEDGSGAAVTVRGDALLLMQFEPASGVDLQGENAVETYKGSKRIDVDDGPVTEIVRTSDFEAHLDWVIGLDAKRPFRISTLPSPPRIIVDIETDA